MVHRSLAKFVRPDFAYEDGLNAKPCRGHGLICAFSTEICHKTVTYYSFSRLWKVWSMDDQVGVGTSYYNEFSFVYLFHIVFGFETILFVQVRLRLQIKPK